MPSELLAILDAGAQYGKVIDRRIRELNVESVIVPINTPIEQLQQFKAFIISGSGESVYDEGAPSYDPRLLTLGKLVLGICYGTQRMNFDMGGEVSKLNRREDGQCQVEIDTTSPLFQGLESNQDVLMSHGDSITSVAPNFRVIARSGEIIAGIEDSEKGLYGIQFHAEVDLTTNGNQILENFVNLAGFSRTYTVEDREQKAIEYIKKTVGDRDVLALVSGGVDSSVCAALLAKALPPKQIHTLHIDTGFMREGESKQVESSLNATGIDLQVVDAAGDFYSLLREVIDPEEKRSIIGDTFMKVAQREIEAMGLRADNVVLAQGTLRPDLIESASTLASSNATRIKTHHNDTNLVRELRDLGRVVEPLKDYHKDEVRVLGEILGLPSELVWRQPFPGPGLAIRVICAEKPYITEDFDRINEQLRKYNSAGMSATLIPIRTVGVQGDGRTYGYLAGISGWDQWDDLFKVAREIPKEIHQINRVAFMFGKKIAEPVRNITPTHLTLETVEQVRKADDIVNRLLLGADLLRSLSQVPVISFPVGFEIPGNRSIAIRTFITNDFMTGVPARPGKEIPVEALETIVEGILFNVPGISRVAYDLTSKPPGTTEWE